MGRGPGQKTREDNGGLRLGEAGKEALSGQAKVSVNGTSHGPEDLFMSTATLIKKSP
jgi:hypothetical protein